MTEPGARLKLCVHCGAILAAADSECPSCRATQPAPGAPRAPVGAGEEPAALLRQLGPIVLVVAVLVVAALGLRALSGWLVGRAGPASGSATPSGAERATADTAGADTAGAEAAGAEAASIEPVAHEAEGDAFDLLMRDGAPTVEVELHRVQETYAVEGRVPAEIFAQIEALGPAGPDGQAVGLTRIETGEYQFQRDERSDRCVVTSLSATLTITLPRLVTDPLPEQVYERWHDYVQAVAEHEQRHADVYAAAVRRIADRLRSMQPFADQAAMETGFRDAWVEEMRLADRENLDFHRREEQGVAFEREIAANEIQRVDRALAEVVARLEARQKLYPDLRLPQAEYDAHMADEVRYDALLAERSGLLERLMWLH